MADTSIKLSYKQNRVRTEILGFLNDLEKFKDPLYRGRGISGKLTKLVVLVVDIFLDLKTEKADPSKLELAKFPLLDERIPAELKERESLKRKR